MNNACKVPLPLLMRRSDRNPSPGLLSQGYTPESFGSRGRGFEPRRVDWEPALSGEQKLDGRAHHCITLGSQGDTRWMRVCARACAAPAGLALVAREAVTPPPLSLSLSLGICHNRRLEQM